MGLFSGSKKTTLLGKIEEALSDVNTGPSPDILMPKVEARVRRRAELLSEDPEATDNNGILIAYIEVVIAAYQAKHQELSSLEGPSYGRLPVEIFNKYGWAVTQKNIFDEAMKSAMLGPFGSLF